MNKIIIALPLLALAACAEPQQSSDTLANQQQERLSKQSVQAVGLPAIVNFQEKRILKDILELRDQPNLVTYTYITDMGGHLHKVCDSIGYGVPYATQYTSPPEAGVRLQQRPRPRPCPHAAGRPEWPVLAASG